MADIINKSGSANYIAGHKIFLLDKLNDETCAELIGNISNMVDNIKWQHQYDTISTQINNPYKINATPQIIDVFINSPGGSVNFMNSIIALLTIARAKNAIIRTNVIGNACSCASMIAVQGTPGFRIMYEQSYHLIHYGSSKYTVNKPTEIDSATRYEKEMRENLNAIYMNNTGLTKSDLAKFQKTEYNYIPAMKCLDKNICDWVLTANGQFITRRQR